MSKNKQTKQNTGCNIAQNIQEMSFSLNNKNDVN